jgi:tRNA-modifying protein YgfZ
MDAETEALRRGAGARRASRDVLAVRGPEAESYLQGQLSQDVAALAQGASADSLLLEPDGKLSALLRVTRLGREEYVLDVEGGYGQAVAARLRRFLLRSKVEMEHLEWRCLSLRGQRSDDVAASLVHAGSEPGCVALPFQWNGWRGADVLGPADLVPDPLRGDVPEGALACGPDAFEACRITSGVPAMGAELTTKTIAAEADLVDRTVNFTKGCYTGQELVARLDARGSKVARRLVGVVAPAGPASNEPLVPGMTLHAGDAPVGDSAADDKVVGTVTSAAWSSELGAWAALAYLHRNVETPGTVRLRTGDGIGGSRPVHVASLPLVDAAEDG